MESNGIANNTTLAIACVFLLVFGFAYNSLVERFLKRTQRYIAEMVVGGVLVTVIVSSLFIGWGNATIVLILFIFSGMPMIIGEWLRTTRDEEEAKKIQKESLK